MPFWIFGILLHYLLSSGTLDKGVMFKLKLNQNNPNTCAYSLLSKFYCRGISREGISLILCTQSALWRFHLIPPTNQSRQQATAKDTVAQKVHNSCTITKLLNEESEVQTHNKNASHCLFPNTEQSSFTTSWASSEVKPGSECGCLQVLVL